MEKWEMYRLRVGKPGPRQRSAGVVLCSHTHTLLTPLVCTSSFYKMKEQEEALFGFLDHHGC